MQLTSFMKTSPSCSAFCFSSSTLRSAFSLASSAFLRKHRGKDWEDNTLVWRGWFLSQGVWPSTSMCWSLQEEVSHIKQSYSFRPFLWWSLPTGYHLWGLLVLSDSIQTSAKPPCSSFSPFAFFLLGQPCRNLIFQGLSHQEHDLLLLNPRMRLFGALPNPHFSGKPGQSTSTVRHSQTHHMTLQPVLQPSKHPPNPQQSWQHLWQLFALLGPPIQCDQFYEWIYIGNGL